MKSIKRIVNMGLIGALSVMCLTGCATNTENPSIKEEQNSAIKEEPKKKDLGLSIEERGEGDFYLVNSVGTTEDDKVLYEFLDNKNTALTQLGYEAWGMNPKKVSYIYLDGKLVEKVVLSDSQMSLTLQNEDLAYGAHTVEVLQFKEGEDLRDDNIEFYEKAEYVITNDAKEYESNVSSSEPKGNESNIVNKDEILEEILQKAMLGQITEDEMAEEIQKQGITEQEFNDYVEEWNNTYGQN